MKVKRIFLIIIISILLCTITTPIFATSNIVQISNGTTTNKNIDVIETTLPNTGVESSGIIFITTIIVLIGAVYSYKKINEYKNF